MAVYWVSSIFGCLWTETKSRAKNTQKENEADIQPSNLFNKGFIVWNTIYLRGTASNSERPREFHLARSGSQWQRGIRFILPDRALTVEMETAPLPHPPISPPWVPAKDTLRHFTINGHWTFEAISLPSADPVQEIFAPGGWIWQVSCLVVAVLVHENKWFVVFAQDWGDSVRNATVLPKEKKELLMMIKVIV